MAALTVEEIERYKRHLVLHDVGGPGQQKLKAARVLVIGAGGLGSPVILYLAAAGVGTIGVVDDDVVSLSNLQRQVLHTTGRVDALKVDSARDHIAQINPHVEVVPHNTRITAANALELIGDHDIVVDGSDNFATRYLVNDACYLARKPLVFAALGRFDGYLTVFRPFETDETGTPRPCYRSIFPEAPPPGMVSNCAEVGILGAVAGVLGTLQATETLKEILGIGESLAGRMVMYDARNTRFETIKLSWDPDNPLNGAKPTIVDLSEHG
ncbi:MAG: HesA/MoeB/ThiF family protein [Pseudomonadota bacterium]